VQEFVRRNPIWSLIMAIVVAVILWLVFAPWSEGLEEAFGRKRIFLNAVFGGITLGALYFLVAAGFTLIFGLMRNVNLAHGSLYLLGGYLGFEISEATGSWLLAFRWSSSSWRCWAWCCRTRCSGAWRGRSCARPW
jgi:branched-chain amino acid transport system permease protein